MPASASSSPGFPATTSRVELQRLVFSFFNADVASRYWLDIVHGMWVTTYLGVAVVLAGLAAGLALAMLRSFQFRAASFLIVVFADVFRALPPLVVIIVLFFAFPYVGLSMSAFAATWLALSLVLAAFAEEIFWAGILSVHKGQTEAARSTGMSRLQTLAYVIVPQAVRLTIPPLTNRMIAITKGTALGSVVAVHEIIYYASSGASEAGNPTPLTLGAAAYLVLFLPVVVFSRWIETRFAWKR
jgi:polar amino acid transport system permease protein